MARRGYPAEFRRRVIDLVEGGRKIAEVSKELGVSQQKIYVWRRQARIAAGLEAGGTSVEQAELAAAKKRIREFETELAIHRRAMERLKGEQLEAERGETLKSSSQKSFADPDANMMMTSEGWLQYCYSGQVAANEDRVIVANEVTTSPLDVRQLVPIVEEIQTTTGRKPGMVVADAGHLSEQNLKLLRKKRQRCLVAVRGRKRMSWPRGSETQRMHRLLLLPWAKKIYRTRKTQGEPPFAEIKQTMRFRRFATRGRANIRGEWDLVCAAAKALTLYRATMA